MVGFVVTGAARADHAAEAEAREDFAAGRYHEALEMFARLYAETLNPVYLRYIGRCHQKLRDPDKAIDSFRSYLATGKAISADERAEITGYINEMEALRAEQRGERAARPPGVAPAPPPPVEPIVPTPPPGGPVNAVAPHPHAPEGGDATVSGGTLVAQPAASPPFYARWWFWTIVGGAILGGVAAVVVLSRGTTKPACSVPGLDILECK
jgi:hypothetical protein